jgi:hypothetical protein
MTPVHRRHERGPKGAPLDLAKRDLTLVLGGRTFAVRAYRDAAAPAGPGWHAVVVEGRTPLRHGLTPTGDPEVCLAAAVRFLTAAVAADAADRRGAEAWESEGGALLGRGERGAAAPLGARRTTAP